MGNTLRGILSLRRNRATATLSGRDINSLLRVNVNRFASARMSARTTEFFRKNRWFLTCARNECSYNLSTTEIVERCVSLRRSSRSCFTSHPIHGTEAEACRARKPNSFVRLQVQIYLYIRVLKRLGARHSQLQVEICLFVVLVSNHSGQQDK